MNAIDVLWQRAMTALEAAERVPCNDDDKGMHDAPADDLFDWADDLEARVGLNVTEFRSALTDFVLVRDAQPGADEVLKRVGL